jgi:hypothetical protein
MSDDTRDAPQAGPARRSVGGIGAPEDSEARRDTPTPARDAEIGRRAVPKNSSAVTIQGAALGVAARSIPAKSTRTISSAIEPT